MIHLAVGVLAISLTCVFLVVLSLVGSGAPRVDRLFVVGTAMALPLSTVFVAYVKAQRL